MKIILSYEVKFRAFGITLGTVKDEVDVTERITWLAGTLISPMPHSILSQVLDKLNGPMPKFAALPLCNERGVYIALEGR